MQKPKTLRICSDSTHADLHTAIYQGVTVASESVTFLVVASICPLKGTLVFKITERM